MSHLTSIDHEYYRCSVHAHRSYTGEPCHPNNTRQVVIARALSEALGPILEGDVDIEDLIQDASPDLARLETEKERLREEIRAIDEKRKRLALALGEGTMDAGPYRAADGELVEQLEGILARIQAIDREITAQPTTEERAAALEELREHWRDDEGAWLREEDGKLRMNAALRQLGVRVICEDCAVVRVSLRG
jgi:chromosome segregation ATPase